MASEFDSELETPEMETLASLAENIVYRLPGCSDIMIRKTIRDVYRDFCRRSCCLCGRRQFKISHADKIIPVPSEYGYVDSVSEVRLNGRVLIGGRDYMVLGGSPVMIEISDRILPREGVEEENLPLLDIVSVQIPRLESESSPRWFIEKYGEYIVSGVLSRIMAMSGKAWSDQPQSKIELLRYENGLNEARVNFYSKSSNGYIESIVDSGDLI